MEMKLLSSGSNAHGQLAHGTVDDAHTFTPCHFASPPSSDATVLDIACGANHTLLLLHSSSDLKNSVWVVGDGSRGQLGTVTGATTFAPLRLPAPMDSLEPVAIAAAWESSYIVLRESDRDVLLSFGANDFGELGRGMEANPSIQPVDLAGAIHCETVKITSLTAGPRHILCLVDCGPTRDGQQRLVGWGASRHGQLGTRQNVVPNPVAVPVAIPHTNHIISIACGNQHTLLLTDNGTVCGLGSDRKGQLAEVLSRITGVREIACTWNTSFLVALNVIHAFGSGNHGQLGREPNTATKHHDIALDPGIRAIAAGSEHVLVLSRDGSVYGWGWNEHGNLGLDHTRDVFAPVALPAIKSSQPAAGRAKVWGGCGTSWVALP